MATPTLEFQRSTFTRGVVSDEARQAVHALRVEEAEAALAAKPDQILTHFGIGTAHNPPNIVVRNEKPWHRTAIILTATGMSQVDIARECGVDRTTVQNAQRQPWFKEKVNEVAEKLGARDTFEMFKAEVQTAQQTVLDIMQNSKSDALKLTAANSVLDRVFGKATQRVEVGAKEVRSADPVAEVARLEQERLAVAKELGQV